MKGTIVQKGHRFYVATHHRLADGKRKQSWHGGYPTKSEAQKALRQVLARLDRGEFVEPSRLTVSTFLVERWLPMKRSTVRPSTFSSYAATIRLHVLPHIGAGLMQALNASDLNRLYALLLESGRRNGHGGGLSPATVRYVHTILRRALADAVRWDLVVRNVADAADPPRQRTGSHDMRTWSANQVREFLTSVEADPLHPPILLAATTGMRRGEILGLRWADVALDEARVSVRQQLVTVNNEMSFTAPKTNRGRRSVDLDPETVRVLRSHRSRQASGRLRWGAAYQDLDLVFAREDGSPLRPDWFSSHFAALVERSPLPRIRFHDLRHTNATLALEAGVAPKVISDRLGHATVAFTMDVYAHSIPALQEDAARRLGALIFSGGD